MDKRKEEKKDEEGLHHGPSDLHPRDGRALLFRRHVEEKLSRFKHVTPSQFQQSTERERRPVTPEQGNISMIYTIERGSQEDILPEVRIESVNGTEEVRQEGQQAEEEKPEDKGKPKDEGKPEEIASRWNLGKLRDEVRRTFSRVSELVSPSYWKSSAQPSPSVFTLMAEGPEGEKTAKEPAESAISVGDQKQKDAPPPSSNKAEGWKSFDLAEKHRKKNPQAYTSLLLRDFVLYLLFLTSVTIVAIGSLHYIMYVYSFVLSDVLTKRQFIVDYEKTPCNFRSLKTMEHLWVFIMDVFLDVVFLQTKREREGRMVLTADEDALFIFQNIIIGVPRIRQVRVRPDSCKIPSDFEAMFTTCYDYYSSESEDKKPFGDKKGSQWTFSKKIADKYSGKVSTYGEGGYYLNLSRNYDTTKKELQNLHKKKWIDFGTRAVFLDFTVYSPNVNLFCVVKLVAELPPSGGVVTSSNLKTLKLIRYVSIWDFFILGLEIVCILFLIYYIIEEIRTVALLKWMYLCSLWNPISLLIIILGCNTFSLAIWRFMAVDDQLPKLIKTIKSDVHGNFDNLAYIQEVHDICLAFFVALVWFKFLKFLMISKVIYHVLATFSKVAFELLGLLFILSIILLSFALLGHLLLGSQVEEFSSIGQSIVSLFILVIGALEYKEIQEIRPILGALFFMLFIFFFVLIFLSLIIAVIVNGFTTLRFDIMEDRSRIYLKDIFYKFFIGIFRCIRMREVATKLEQKQEDDKVIDDYQVILETLRRSGFRGRELEAFLKKYGVEEGKPISDETLQKMYDDIDAKSQLYLEAVEHEQIMSQLDILKVRMNYVDRRTEEMSAKVELLLEKVIRK